MGKVIYNNSISLGGFVTGPNDLEPIHAIPAPGVTHLAFRVVR